MNNSGTNRNSEGEKAACFSVDRLIDYAFEQDDPTIQNHIDQCTTCRMIYEGILYEIETRKNAGEMVSSDLLKIQNSHSVILSQDWETPRKMIPYY